MKINTIDYDKNGRILAPHSLDLKNKIPSIYDPITVDAGFYHRQRVTGATPAERDRALQAVAAQVTHLPGYVYLGTRKFHTTLGRREFYGYDVLYAIEQVRPSYQAQAA